MLENVCISVQQMLDQAKNHKYLDENTIIIIVWLNNILCDDDFLE